MREPAERATLLAAAAEAPFPLSQVPDPSDASDLFWLAAGGLSLFVSAAGAATADALLTYSPTRLGRTERGERVLGLLARREYDFTALAKTVQVVFLCAAAIAVDLGSGGERVFWLAVLGLTAIVLTGVFPSKVAQTRPERVLIRTLPLLEIVRWVLRYPVLTPVGLLARLLHRLWPTGARTETDVDPTDELITAVSDSVPDVDIGEEGSLWIENIVELESLTAKDAMTARTDVVGFPQSMPLTEAIERSVQTGYSRYPVHTDNLDQVLGVFYAKDALVLIAEGQDPTGRTVDEFAREALFVEEKLPLADLLKRFRATKRHLAIVRDEYGGTRGIVTVEDVVEEIVGDIEDEFDLRAAALHVVEDGRRIEVDGRVRIDEINEVLTTPLPEGEHYDTIAGWIFTTLNRIPGVGEEFTIGPVDLKIIEANERRILRVAVEVRESTTKTARNDEN